MYRLLVLAAAAFIAGSPALAATMTIGDVSFDTDNSAISVVYAQGGHFFGPAAGRRDVGDAVPEAVGFDLTTSVEIDKNGPDHPDDILAATFANPLANGAGSCAVGNYAGCDVLVFEVLNQPDTPTVALSIGGTSILGVLLVDTIVATSKGNKRVGVYGFDFSLLSIAVGDAVNNPIYISRPATGEGTPDVAAIVGLNFAQPPPPQIPLPAAAPLFIAGLAGLGFVKRRRKTA